MIRNKHINYTESIRNKHIHYTKLIHNKHTYYTELIRNKYIHYMFLQLIYGQIYDINLGQNYIIIYLFISYTIFYEQIYIYFIKLKIK